MQELVFLRAVSSAIASASGTPEAVEHIADLLMEIPGVTGVEFPGVKLSSGDTTLQPVATATAKVVGGRRIWGEILIRFAVSGIAVESPVRLARFAGQQIGLLLARAAAEARKQALSREVGLLQDDLYTRKILDRAIGIFAREQGVSASHAGTMLRAHSRRTGRPLRHLAEAIIRASGVSRADAPAAIRKTA